MQASPWLRFRTLLLAGACALLVAGTLSRAADGKELTLVQRVSKFKKAIRNTRDPKARMKAFEYLRGANDPSVIDHVTFGIKAVRASGDKIRKDQATIEAAYEKHIGLLEQANQTLDASGHSARDVARYNKVAGKISKAMDNAVLQLKNLENDFSRNRAMVTQAVVVAGELLEKLEGERLADALERLRTQWLLSKTPEIRMLWVDALREAGHPEVTRALHAAERNVEIDTPIRVRAIDALAARKDGEMFGRSMEYLKLPVEQQPFIFAAIRFLRRMHDKRGIEPLIQFLDRTDIKRSRNDAQLALASLTGVDHGPYGAQWKKWWEDNHKTFTMPKEPKSAGNVKAPQKGKTFYGVHTFSDKILYIVDISLSMERKQRGEGGGGKSKMEILKQELIGAVFNLNATDTFNVIFFNHQVLPWQAKKVVANERNKNLLKKWVTEQPPLGGTNIYDSLEMGFRTAQRAKGTPEIDTIFFLTDGIPTAGKFRDPARMLELLKAWNDELNLTIHTIGIGSEHDADFLQKLAAIGDGTYVKR